MGIFDFLKKKEDEKPGSSERPAYDKASLEEFKAQLNKAKEEQGDWKTPYTELMKAVYEQPVLFFALSREQYDMENNTSIPLISTKDFGGVPALYGPVCGAGEKGLAEHHLFPLCQPSGTGAGMPGGQAGMRAAVPPV